MKAARVHRFGPPNVITIDDLPRPEPAAGEVLMHVNAAGVGNWDALIREGTVQLQPLPLVLGSELSGVVERIGPDVFEFNAGDEVFGATNAQISWAYAEYALASHRMLAQKSKTLNFIEAASAPIVAVTAWQMLFEYADVVAGHTVLVHGGAGMNALPDNDAAERQRMESQLAGENRLLQASEVFGRGLSRDVPTATALLHVAEKWHGEYEATAPKHHWSQCMPRTSWRAC